MLETHHCTHTTIQQLQAHAKNRKKATHGSSSSTVNISSYKRHKKKGYEDLLSLSSPVHAACFSCINSEEKRSNLGRDYQIEFQHACLLFGYYVAMGCEHKLTVAKKDFTGFFRRHDLIAPSVGRVVGLASPLSQVSQTKFRTRMAGVTIQHGTCRNAGPFWEAVRDSSEHLCLVLPKTRISIPSLHLKREGKRKEAVTPPMKSLLHLLSFPHTMWCAKGRSWHVFLLKPAETSTVKKLHDLYNNTLLHVGGTW